MFGGSGVHLQTAQKAHTCPLLPLREAPIHLHSLPDGGKIPFIPFLWAQMWKGPSQLLIWVLSY